MGNQPLLDNAGLHGNDNSWRMRTRRNIPVLCCLLAIGVASLQAQQTRRLDTTTFVVLGEGLAAGMANFGLNEVVQDKSFPAQMARQMNTAFPHIPDIVGKLGPV